MGEEEGKLKRITKTAIAEKVTRPHLILKNLNKLPTTMEYLMQNVESVNDFQIRRVLWAVEELKRMGEEIIEWRVVKTAKLNPASTSLEVYELIKNFM